MLPSFVVHGVDAVATGTAIAEEQTGVAAAPTESAGSTVAPQQPAVTAVAGSGARGGICIEAVADQPATRTNERRQLRGADSRSQRGGRRRAGGPEQAATRKRTAIKIWRAQRVTRSMPAALPQ